MQCWLCYCHQLRPVPSHHLYCNIRLDDVLRGWFCYSLTVKPSLFHSLLLLMWIDLLYTVLTVITGAQIITTSSSIYLFFAVFVLWSFVYVCIHRQAEHFSLFLIIQWVVSSLIIFLRIFFCFNSSLFVVLSAGSAASTGVCCQPMSHWTVISVRGNHSASLSNDPISIINISDQTMRGPSSCDWLLSKQNEASKRSKHIVNRGDSVVIKEQFSSNGYKRMPCYWLLDQHQTSLSTRHQGTRRVEPHLFHI